MLRRSVILSLAIAACGAQAADPLPSLKVDPSLLPPSKRPAKTAEKAGGKGGEENRAPAAAGDVPAATTDPAAAQTFPVDVPKNEAVPRSQEQPTLRAEPPAAESGAAARAVQLPPGAVRSPAKGRPAVPVAAQPSLDEPPPHRNVTTARNLPALKVDPSLMGAPPVARRRVPAPAGAGAVVARQGDAADASGSAGVMPPVVQEDDESQVMRGAITLSEYMERNPQSRATLIAGDQLDGTTDSVMRAVGSAELRQPATSLTADTIVYEPPTDELQADGNVRLVRGEDVVEGPSLRYRLARSEGVIESPRYTLRRNLQTGENLRTTTGRGVADKMEFLGENRVRMSNATYSTCGPDNPDWYAQAEALNLDFESEEGDGRHGKIVFMGVPVLYSPWLDFSLNNRRKSGFLSPTFGVTNRTGFDLLLPYYWNIAPNMDATIAPRFLGTRGLMLSNEFRYLDPAYQGTVRLDYLFNDRILERDRHALNIQHRHQITDRLSGQLNISAVSDRDYYTDLGNRLAITSIGYLARQGTLTYAGDWWRVTGGATEYQALANLAPIYSRLPSLQLDAYRADLPAGLVFRLNSSYNDFRIDSPDRDQGRRTVFYPQLSLPVQSAFMTITPKVGVHASYYDIERGTTNVALDDSLSRAIPIFSLDATTVFERDSDLFGQGYVQTLEPRLYYVLAPYKNQSQFPVFDSALADFNFAQIFSENVFVGQDRISDSNQLTAATISRFIDPESGAERARVALGQRIYFADQKVVLPGGTQRTGSIASTLAAVSGELLPKTWVDAAVQYNTDLSQTERYSFTARWNPREAHALNASYRFRRAATSAADVRDLDLAGQWPLTNRWYAVGRHNYSIAERRLIEGLAGLEYNGGCWVGRIVFQRIATNVQRVRTALFFQLELNDFSRLGSNPLDALKRSIPGYGQINQSVADPVFGDEF